MIYNGVDVDDIPFSDEPEDFFLIVGRMVPEKGIADAIRIARRNKAKLLIVGHVTSHLPWSEEYFLKEVKPHIDGDKIRYIERLAHRDLAQTMRKAKGLLFPIRWDEPFGMVVIEAMAAGTPVLAYGRGSMPELINDGETGYLMQSEDEMVEALQRLEALDRARCREWVRERFSVERMIDGYERLYKDIAKKSPRLNTFESTPSATTGGASKAFETRALTGARASLLQRATSLYFPGSENRQKDPGALAAHFGGSAAGWEIFCDALCALGLTPQTV